MLLLPSPYSEKNGASEPAGSATGVTVGATVGAGDVGADVVGADVVGDDDGTAVVPAHTEVAGNGLALGLVPCSGVVVRRQHQCEAATCVENRGSPRYVPKAWSSRRHQKCPTTLRTGNYSAPVGTCWLVYLFTASWTVLSAVECTVTQRLWGKRHVITAACT